MKNHIILETTNALLYLLNEQGQLQQFDLSKGVMLSLQNGQLNIGALQPHSADEVVRELLLDSTQIKLCFSWDESGQILSIVRIPQFASGSSAVAGGKIRLGSVDLTLSRNEMTASTTNLGVKEEAGVMALENKADSLEWYLLNMRQFDLVIAAENGHLKLSTLATAVTDSALS